MKFELFIAWRYLVARHKEKFISLIGLISVFGVAIGVAALIIVLSVMAGFDNDLKEKIIGLNPHITIENMRGVSEADSFIDKLKSDPAVLNLSLYINGQVIVKTDLTAAGALIRGIERAGGDAAKIKKILVKGDLPNSPRQIVVGKELARMLNIGPGGKLRIISPDGVKAYDFSVSGIFACGMYDYDANLVFTDLRDAQEIFVSGGRISGVGFDLKDPYRADVFAEGLRRDLNYAYSVKTWMETNSSLFSALKLEKIAMFIILTLIVIVACFNIASTLIMMVVEKTQDIGILKAIGATNAAVRFIFTLEGLIIGFIGTAFGLAVGIGACKLLQKYQFIQLPREVYYIDHLPVQMRLNDLITISAAAILISLLATFYPARQASRLEPVEALRYE